MGTLTAKYIKSNTEVLPTIITAEMYGWTFEAQNLKPSDPLDDEGDDPSDYAPGWIWTAGKPGEFAMSEESATDPAPEWAIRLGRAMIKAIQDAPISEDYHRLAEIEINY